MKFLGPIIVIVGIAIALAAAVLWYKSRDKRTSRQKHLDQIAEMRGDSRAAKSRK